MYTKYKNYQRTLRKNMPLPEVVLWQKIRKKQLGVKFRRQYAIDNRILDFYAPAIKLAIEVDGDTHYNLAHQHELELKKDEELYKKHGIHTVRFLNSEVMHNLPTVIELITKHITTLTHPHPNPPPSKGGGD